MEPHDGPSARSSGTDSVHASSFISSNAVVSSSVQVFRGKKLKDDEANFLAHNRFLRAMTKAAADLVDERRLDGDTDRAAGSPNEGLPRRYYYISIMKVVHKYNEFESFGELALI